MKEPYCTYPKRAMAFRKKEKTTYLDMGGGFWIEKFTVLTPLREHRRSCSCVRIFHFRLLFWKTRSQTVVCGCGCHAFWIERWRKNYFCQSFLSGDSTLSKRSRSKSRLRLVVRPVRPFFIELKTMNFTHHSDLFEVENVIRTSQQFQFNNLNFLVVINRFAGMKLIRSLFTNHQFIVAFVFRFSSTFFIIKFFVSTIFVFISIFCG